MLLLENKELNIELKSLMDILVYIIMLIIGILGYMMKNRFECMTTDIEDIKHTQNTQNLIIKEHDIKIGEISKIVEKIEKIVVSLEAINITMTKIETNLNNHIKQ